MSNAKRFYKSISIEPFENGFKILLDKFTLKTPKKKDFVAPNMAIAQLVADEWDAQKEEIIPHNMPLTRLINVAIDCTDEARIAMAAELKKYASSDLLCYQVSKPMKLAQMQEEIWGSIWQKFHANFDIKFEIIIDSFELKQSSETLDKIYDLAINLDNYALTALSFCTTLTGSPVLALLIMKGLINADEAFKAIRIDEDHNAQIWGYDEDDVSKANQKLFELKAMEKLSTAL